MVGGGLGGGWGVGGVGVTGGRNFTGNGNMSWLLFTSMNFYNNG